MVDRINLDSYAESCISDALYDVTEYDRDALRDAVQEQTRGSHDDDGTGSRGGFNASVSCGPSARMVPALGRSTRGDSPMSTYTHCHDCGAALPTFPPGHTGGTGYGLFRENGAEVPVCYACCAKRDRASMVETGRATLYLTKDGSGHWQVGNWPGSLQFRAGQVRKVQQGFCSGYLAYFTGPDNATWSAKNLGDNDIAHCRRLKGS